MQSKSTEVPVTKKAGMNAGLGSLIRDLLLMAVCCVLGVLVKHMVNPAANAITDAMHIPGGISTAFSLMFMVFAQGVTQRKWGASMMGAMQGITALSIGMVGSMGILMPLAYLVPGIVIDLVMLFPGQTDLGSGIKVFLAGVLGSVSAALFADLVVFRLPSIILVVYLGVAAISGALCGMILIPAVRKGSRIYNNNQRR